MFGRVAPRYDLLNHLLSFNLDRRWRSRTVRRVTEVLQRPDARVADLCCGTGDLMLALERAHGGPVLGIDFCHPMLMEAGRKAARRQCRSVLVEADALRLPLPDRSLDLVTIAFGFRNLTSYQEGLAEMRRVLRPSGVAAILEFSQAQNPLMARVYGLYSKRVLPIVGGALSGDRGAYEYLPESVRKFPGPVELAEVMALAGFENVEFELLTGGIVALHLGAASR
jgi:demethylmenaquinone methyltransferase/2-methoxy-6-polyprenyl-1,4-benzoquinol methylase